MNKEELIKNLIKRSKSCYELAEGYELGTADYARCRGKAQAYEHAAELADEFDSRYQHWTTHAQKATNKQTSEESTLYSVKVTGLLPTSIVRMCLLEEPTELDTYVINNGESELLITCPHGGHARISIKHPDYHQFWCDFTVDTQTTVAALYHPIKRWRPE